MARSDPPVDTPTEFPAGEWPEAPTAPVAPSFDAQPGDRVKIHTNVAIFGFEALQTVEAFDHPELRAAAAAGLVDILDDSAPADLG